MYMILNLATGGNWGGAADGVSSGQMQVDYARAYALADSPVTASQPAAYTAPAATTTTAPATVAPPAGPATATTPVTATPVVAAPAAPLKTLEGTAATDHHQIKLSDLDVHATGVQVKINAFGGAGQWQATDNDWVSLLGFSKGSTLSWNHDSATDSKDGFYTLHDAATNHDFSVEIYSTDGKHAALGDFNFY